MGHRKGLTRAIRLLRVAAILWLLAQAACTTDRSALATGSTAPATPVPGATSDRIARDDIVLPEYLGRVWPSPGSAITVQEYEESLKRDSFLQGEPGVGVQLLAHRIAEKGAWTSTGSDVARFSWMVPLSRTMRG